MENPHPLWECWGCHRQWQWPTVPVACGFCASTYVVAVNPPPVVVVAIERGPKIGRRGGLGTIIRPPGPRIARCTVCGGLHHNRLSHKTPAAARLTRNGVTT